MTNFALTLLERFGDAHLRYSTRTGALIDVIREPQGHWVAYEMQPDAQIGHEVETASSESTLLKLLERKLQSTTI